MQRKENKGAKLENITKLRKLKLQTKIRKLQLKVRERSVKVVDNGRKCSRHMAISFVVVVTISEARNRQKKPRGSRWAHHVAYCSAHVVGPILGLLGLLVHFFFSSCLNS
jgi:hypothetical protein